TLSSTLIADNVSNTTPNADFFDLGTTNADHTLVQTSDGNTVTGTNGNIVAPAGSQIPDSSINLSTTLQTASNGTQYFTLTSVTSDAFKNGVANSLTTDQIGHVRTVAGNVDIGAMQTGTTVTAVPFILASSRNGFVEVINAVTHQVIQNFQPIP